MREAAELAKTIEMVQKNQEKFSLVKKLNLPIDQYALTGSGALGIRNLREIADIDIIVTSPLWNILAAKYGVTDENMTRKIVFPGGLIEAFGENSFYGREKEKDALTIADRIAKSEIIDHLPFESLETLIKFKRKMGREKDLVDISLIEKKLNEKSCFEVRAVVGNIKAVQDKLSLLNASFEGDYSFKDSIYNLKNCSFDLNREFVRLRVYHITNWNQKALELTYKMKIIPGQSGTTLFKKEFNAIAEAELFLKDYSHLFSYSRNGLEYKLGEVRIFLEEIEELPPTIELLYSSQEEINHLLKVLSPIKILSESVPKLVENKRLC